MENVGNSEPRDLLHYVGDPGSCQHLHDYRVRRGLLTSRSGRFHSGLLMGRLPSAVLGIPGVLKPRH